MIENRKNHNSMIFLTTLGVYLGLLLVGGSAPQVYAHAAMTRNFEIQDEIEVRDDLDNKPDDERTPLTVSLEVYLQDVEYFVGGLRKLNNLGKFDIGSDTFEVSQSTLLPCVPANTIGSYTAASFVSKNESLRPNLEWFSKRLTDGYSLADCLPNERFAGKDVTASNFQLKLDKTEFSIQVAVKKSSGHIAKVFTGDLDRTLKLYNNSVKNAVVRKICDSTTFWTENEQVFVVTRLPRAAIDPLLAKDA
jgi:hypothetical protein